MKNAFFPPEDKEASTPEEWIALQKEDGWCKRIVKRIGKKNAKPIPFAIRDGLLCKKANLIEESHEVATSLEEAFNKPRQVAKHGGPTRQKWRIVVPQSLKAQMLRRTHGLPIAGHMGRKRTYENLSAKFHWKGMYSDVKRWVRACSSCTRRKQPRPMSAAHPLAIVTPHPGHTVCVDILTPLPETARGNVAILTVFDPFVRWPIAVPLTDLSAATIADAIFTHYLCEHGRPVKILSDQGKNLTKAMEYLCRRWSIKKVETTGYNAQANPVERFHRFLNAAMTQLHGELGLDWDRYLAAALLMYRSSVCEATGYTPFYMLHGREMIQPADLMLSVGTETEDVKSAEKHGTDTCARLAKAYEQAYKHQLASAEKNMIARESFLRNVQYEPGAEVFYYQPTTSNKEQLDSAAHKEESEQGKQRTRLLKRLPSKWTYKWTGPHTVVGKVENKPNSYRIRLSEKDKEVTAHVNRLCKAYSWSESIKSTSEIPSATPDSYLVGGKVEIGDLFVIALEDDNCPIGIGKLESRDEKGHFSFQWLGNKGDLVTAPNSQCGEIPRAKEETWSARGSSGATFPCEALTSKWENRSRMET